MIHRIKILLLVVLAVVTIGSCKERQEYTAVDGSNGPLIIYPDYKEVTIPANIAPLNFHYAVRNI